MAEVSTGAAIYVLAVLLFIIILYLRGKKKYTQYCDILDKKEYPLKSLTILGFAFMELIRYKYATVLDRKLRKQINELRERDYVEFYLRVTWATAATYFIICVFFSAILALAEVGFATVAVALFFGVGLGYAVIAGVSQKIAKRHLSIAYDLPDFTNKVLILSGAGLSIRAAIVKISNDLPKDTPFYQELKKSVFLMENGETVERAMDILCIKCNMPEVRRMVSVMVQNMNRGGTDVLVALKEIGKELWNERRAVAKRVAEQAGTKLLFPMMLMLLAVILIVAAPAVMSLGMAGV
ncbi:MAG: type II secretion system F family protein [Lachnospiraceae bacterium]|nr:type II secretion system F family protein [Lachnospiraceae bacterium]